MENYVSNVIPHVQQWWPVIITLTYMVGVGFAVVSCVQAINHSTFGLIYPVISVVFTQFNGCLQKIESAFAASV